MDGACPVNAFAYIGTAKAPLYRAIMQVFTAARQRLVFRLRPHEVLDGLRALGIGELPAETELDSVLEQLCTFGNLQKVLETRHASTIQDYFQPNHTFQLTQEGEAAERAFELYAATLEHGSELQCDALADLAQAVQDLEQLAREANPDAGRIHRRLQLMQTRFRSLTATAQALVAGLERGARLQPSNAPALAEFGERFVGELVLAADNIGEHIRKIEAAGLERLLQAAAERTVRSGIDRTPERLATVRDEWRAHWECFRNWFVSTGGRPSSAGTLRERVRGAIPALLSAFAAANGRGFARMDRSTDFCVLAQWFAEAESDEEAHRLWRAVFGLSASRHLIVNDATLDDHEAQDVRPNVSWHDAPPLRTCVRFRDHHRSPPGGLSRIIDRTAEKEKLAAAAREDALRILNARARFGAGGRMRLSELEHLEAREFDLLLDILAEAVSARLHSTEAVEVLSGDGCLKVKLEPAADGREALILTAKGTLLGPDHWISIERVAAEETQER
jgi:uncharacterized protein (TIGR02677 family)